MQTVRCKLPHKKTSLDQSSFPTHFEHTQLSMHNLWFGSKQKLLNDCFWPSCCLATQIFQFKTPGLDRTRSGLMIVLWPHCGLAKPIARCKTFGLDRTIGCLMNGFCLGQAKACHKLFGVCFLIEKSKLRQKKSPTTLTRPILLCKAIGLEQTRKCLMNCLCLWG